MTLAGHGPNIGHGWTKYVIIGADGRELPAVCFPSVIASAGRQVAGALRHAPVATVAGQGRYWTGLDAQLSGNPITIMSQNRLADPRFIPALLAGALDRMGHLNGSGRGVFVSGLPGSQSLDADLCRALAELLRLATPSDMIAKMKIIGEPLGLAYAYLLDNNGQLVGEADDLASGRIGVADLGHRTVDLAELLRLGLVDRSFRTFDLGTSKPLGEIAPMLAARIDRDVSLLDADFAVRDRAVRVNGKPMSLPRSWDAPLIENGKAIAARMRESWGSGTQFDRILLGGGGAELESVTAQITKAFPQAVVVERPQIAIALGYARLARRVATNLR